ncbi:MAG TPA: hypothetical protein VOA41_00650 [Candidatus Dormibacteraeota bacterium]|nr:hypothetical protein [Candidatus Dormibacteraeota bacterium]
MLRWFLLCIVVFGAAAASGAAQNRPSRTADAEIIEAGTLRAEVGFEFLQDIDFPLSGLSGDLTSVGVTNLRLGLGKIVEVQLDGAIQNFLDVKKHGVSYVPDLRLSDTNSTHDIGDFSLATKIRMLSEAERRPALGLRFGFKLPNSKQSHGIGTNTLNVFGLFIMQKHFGRLNIYGNSGLAILQAPNGKFSQNDELLYGTAFNYPVHRLVNVVGEVAGRYNARKINVNLVGTESQSQARLGVQILAGGFRWDFAGIAGISKNDARSGFTFGVSKDFKLFDSGH